jgi:hypothetical protein
MPKGQQRSNRERKKPKQPKPAPAVPASPFAAPEAGSRAGGAVKKK